jgi:hypothetical protein
LDVRFRFDFLPSSVLDRRPPIPTWHRLMYRVSLACCVVVTIALDCRFGSSSSATLISFCIRVLGMEA